MIETLKKYNEQFKFVPEIINEHLVHKHFKRIILCGMGGSHLPAGIIQTIDPSISIIIHSDYDLPPYEKTFLEDSLLIASSFSGTTAEVISFYKKTKQLYDLPVLCISTGGELLELAIANNDPYILLPKSEFVPRTALGYSTIALACVYKDKKILYALKNIHLNMEELEEKSKSMIDICHSKIPLIYTSLKNKNIGYNWKIKFNETSKKMAFCNVCPEFNHNELESYEYLTSNTHMLPIILIDEEDDSRIKKRFEVFIEILKEKNIEHLIIDISNVDIITKVFSAIVLGDFLTTYVAQANDVPSSKVPLIESFKRSLI